ncbi:MAG TPA: ribosome silencing factor [Terriglobales bacterium]|nr:ribosome silencing factor [Terriglobales bacterium]
MKISSQRLANLIGQYALEKKAGDVKVLDLRKLADITDYFLICSAEVELQARAIADHIVESLKKKGIRAWHAEGYQNSKWILIDYVDVVVHIFLNETREFYGLERLWGDAKVKEIKEKKRLPKKNRSADSRSEN